MVCSHLATGDPVRLGKVEFSRLNPFGGTDADGQAWLAGDPFALDHAALPQGTTLGPYRVDALLDAGGMGEVYRAHDTMKSKFNSLPPWAPARVPVSLQLLAAGDGDLGRRSGWQCENGRRPQFCAVHP